MVVFDIVKDNNLGLNVTPPAALGGSDNQRVDPDNYWTELYWRVTKGTLAGGSSPAWTASAGDKLVSELSMNLGGSITPIKASFENLKRLTLLETGEEVSADGYGFMPLYGAFPSFLFKNGARFIHNFADIEDVTTGSPTSQSGTQIDWFAKTFPRQGRPRNPVGFPVIKTVTKDLSSVSGRKEVLNLNSGNLLRHMLIIPSSGTLINNVEVSLSDGEDVWRAHDWDVLREQNKKDYFFDLVQPAAGFGAYTFPHVSTDRGAVGKLALYADVESESGGQVTVVTLERMAPADEGRLLEKLKQ